MQAPPSATTWALPLTGAARKPTPAAFAAARTPAEAAADTVEQSTIVPGLRSPLSSPCSPQTTSSRSRGADTMTKTMSHPPRSVIRPTARAPLSTSGPVLDAVRFHTQTRSPASIRRPAMAAPIRPVPSQPRLRAVRVHACSSARLLGNGWSDRRVLAALGGAWPGRRGPAQAGRAPARSSR